MARRGPGRPFKKGLSGNPGGRPSLPPEARKFQTAAKAEIIEEFKFLWSLTETELIDIIRTKDGGYKKQLTEYSDVNEDIEIENHIPAVRKFIARAIIKAVRSGDMHHIGMILDRVIGKVKDEIDLNSKVSLHKRIVDLMLKIEGGGSFGDEEN